MSTAAEFYLPETWEDAEEPTVPGTDTGRVWLCEPDQAVALTRLELTAIEWRECRAFEVVKLGKKLDAALDQLERVLGEMREIER
jgi:hypothetical protein